MIRIILILISITLKQGCVLNGTGDFLKLHKRNCPINIELDPVGADMLDISMDICGKHYDFSASSVMGRQFGVFLSAVYYLYRLTDCWEKGHFDPRREFVETDYSTYARSRLSWDPEGGKTVFVLTRYYNQSSTPNGHKDDVINLTINGLDTFDLDGRDLCYAVAKACTDVLKRCGIYGYYLSTGANCSGYGDSFDIQHLLFVKAYALNAEEVRHPYKIHRDPFYTEVTSFGKETELLLFDM